MVPVRDAGLGKAFRHPAMGATPMPGTGEPPLRGWAATGGWRGPSVLLALLLLLCPLPAPACPHTCHCQAGDVDCHQRDLHEVPRLLPTNASTLWLDYNLIAVLRAHAFPSLPVLLRLSLTHNRLEKIHRQALLGLGTLQELDLSDNYLSVLSPETFLPLTSLSILNLGYNRLEQLEAGVLPALPQLQAIFLNGNPWMCSCSILPLWRWLEHNREKVPERSSLRCMFPKSLNTYPIMAFGNDSFQQCQKIPLSAQNYAAFLLIGPFSFLASIFCCTLIGSIVVIYHHLRKEPQSWRRTLSTGCH
ncbi:leucine-rich repeat-containing protein 26 [Centrocercus urophasianus]|uniref:leucine-rich repeat-containing protein 26 n=1 Tax=Centrocercus urophasianus TaxID=9002 RepID=UPI001C652BAA|nr:leucine-rich repeat-containing protein 26 [Centrocercus urophasianus]